MNTYYVYLYTDPFTQIPFYVGKGKNNRFSSHLWEAKTNRGPNHHKINKIRKIQKNGMDPIIRIIDDNLSNDLAVELEIFLISEIGRADLKNGPLTNLTNGGEGTPGVKKQVSEQTKEKLRAAAKNKSPMSAETCQKISASKLGKKRNPELMKRLGAMRRGKPLSQKTRDKMSLIHKGENHHYYGKHRDEVTKKKISDKLKGQNHPNAMKWIITDSKGNKIKTKELNILCKQLGMNVNTLRDTRRLNRPIQKGLFLGWYLEEDLD